MTFALQRLSFGGCGSPRVGATGSENGAVGLIEIVGLSNGAVAPDGSAIFRGTNAGGRTVSVFTLGTPDTSA